MNKQQALKIISTCSKLYETNLKNKKLLFIYNEDVRNLCYYV